MPRRPICFYRDYQLRYMDADGGGFRANGDLLGWPLPTKMSVVEAKALLEMK